MPKKISNPKKKLAAPRVAERPGAVSLVSAATAPGASSSQIDFNVHPGIAEIRSFAHQQGWLARGWTHLSTYGVELVYTTDHWATTRTLKSSQVPSPYVNGRFLLADLPTGTNLEFAIKTYLACSGPKDRAGYRERGEVWLNNGGRNFTQLTR